MPAYRAHQAHIYWFLAHLLAANARPRDAEEAYRQLLLLEEQVVREVPRDPHPRSLLVGGHRKLSDLLKSTGRYQDAEKVLRRGVEFFEKLAADSPSDSRLQKDLEAVRQNLKDFVKERK